MPPDEIKPVQGRRQRRIQRRNSAWVGNGESSQPGLETIFVTYVTVGCFGWARRV